MLAPESILLRHDMVSTWHIFLPCCLKNDLPLISSAGTVLSKVKVFQQLLWQTKGVLNVITKSVRNSYTLDKMTAKPLWLLNDTQCFFPRYYFKIVISLGLKPWASPTFNPCTCFLAISHPWSLNSRKIADTVMQVHALQRQRCPGFPGWPVWLWKDIGARGPMGYEHCRRLPMPLTAGTLHSLPSHVSGLPCKTLHPWCIWSCYECWCTIFQ